MGKTKSRRQVAPGRASKALKRYWRDVRAIRAETNQSTALARGSYKRALAETQFDRKQISRDELVQVVASFIEPFEPGAKEIRLGDTVFMSIDGWMDRAVRLGYEMRFELKFYEVKSVIAGDPNEALDIRSNIRREGDDFFKGDPEMGAPSFYWRIRLPIGVYTDSKTYYRFVWPDSGARDIVKDKEQAIEDVIEGETEETEEMDREEKPVRKKSRRKKKTPRPPKRRRKARRKGGRK